MLPGRRFLIGMFWLFLFPALLHTEVRTGVYYTSDKAYVSPDMAVIFNIGSICETPVERPIQMIFDAPEGIRVVSADFQGGGRVALKEEPLDNGTFKGTRYILELGSVTDYHGWLQLYLATTWTEGRKATGYLRLTWKGGGQPAQNIEFTCIRIPSAASPRRIVAGMAIYHQAYERWPDFLKTHRALGMNQISLANNNLYSAESVENVDTFVKNCREAGIWLSGVMWQGFPNGAELQADPDAQQVNIAGARIQRPCPSYRGPLFEKYIEKAKNVVHHGISWLEYDEEGLFAGDNSFSICFCDRCKNSFRNFLARKYPNLKYVDPSVFEQDFSKYPELDKAWLDFKTDMIADCYRAVRNAVEPEVVKLAVCSGPKPRLILSNCLLPRFGNYTIENQLHDINKLAAVLDYLEPMSYTGFEQKKPAWVGEIAEFFSEKAGNQRGAVLVLPDAGDSWLDRPVLKKAALEKMLAGGNAFAVGVYPNEYVRDDILEAVMGGAKGYIIWKYIGLDGLDFRYLAQTNAILARVEDIILDGAPADVRVVRSDKPVGVRARTHEGKTVILVSEYATDAPVTVSLEVKRANRGKQSVIDMYTGKSVAEFSDEKKTFDLIIDKDRARFFLVE